MLNIEKYAAIDIGSNAIRLLIVSVIEYPGKETQFKKTSLVRVPVRLGSDVFVKGEISEENYSRMADSLLAFQLLMKTHHVSKYRACATSAMRDASNGEEVAHRIAEKTGIKIEIIDGNEEAALIASTDLDSYLQSDKVYLYVDVGGGSTEFSIFEDGKLVTSRSFRLGTVRLLKDIVDDSIWVEVKAWIKRSTKEYSYISLLGSGGNINSIYKNSGKKIGEPLSYFYLAAYYEHMNQLTYEERIVDENMNADRADVIVPATKIFLSAMKWSGAKNIYVPKIGLSDGIIRSMYTDKTKA